MERDEIVFIGMRYATLAFSSFPFIYQHQDLIRKGEKIACVGLQEKKKEL